MAYLEIQTGQDGYCYLKDKLHQKFPEKILPDNCSHCSCRPRTERYIGLQTSLKDSSRIYYRYYHGHVMIFFGSDYPDIHDYIRAKLEEGHQTEFEWIDIDGGEHNSCQYIKEVHSEEDLLLYMGRLISALDPILNQYQIEEQQNSVLRKELPQMSDNPKKVELYTWSLLQVLNLPLEIPDYQRIYCWGKDNVTMLWNDISKIKKGEKYRTGTLILHKYGEVFHIIDGQQRLVTLSLILSELHKTGIPLLSKKYNSREAEAHIRYNKYHIHNLLYNNDVSFKNRGEKADTLLDGVEFSVLVLDTESLDLAYTFFSNENSRGKALSNFDLLKAHHLRYISDNPLQASHLAKRWDKMLLEGSNEQNESERKYVRTLEYYIFRLRKWIRKKTWDEQDNYRVKKEFEAAQIIPELPAFGEQFDWNESIQGGPHFFGLVDKFISQFNSFQITNEYKAIHKLSYNSQRWYRDVIETFLFAYYLKFGNQYLSEALFVITTVISNHRYLKERAIKSNILEYAGDSEIVMMIDRATSPTFFLAEMLSAINSLPPIDETKMKNGVRKAYREELKKGFLKLKDTIEVKSIKELF